MHEMHLNRRVFIVHTMFAGGMEMELRKRVRLAVISDGTIHEYFDGGT